MKRGALRGEALLLLAAAIWGFAFVAQRAGMEHIGPFLFNGARFALGAAVLLPIWWWRSGRIEAGALGAGVAVGLVLFVSSALQQAGLIYTTAGRAGFITGLYVVLVPIVAVCWGGRVGLAAWIGVALAASGLYLLSADASAGVGLGDMLVVASAFGWTGHVLLVDRFTRRTDAISFALVQFAVCSALSLAAAALLERAHAVDVRGAALPIVYGGALSVGVAYTLQVLGQRSAPPTAAALLLSTEAVFAALGGAWLLGESLRGRSLTGCALMLVGVVVSQLRSGTRP
jgi:drug/metabolite transporter (DMT)-like permease